MGQVKRCVQCGILKDDFLFRQYTYSKTNETAGRYRICKSCEAINSAYHKAKVLTDDALNMSNPAAWQKAHVIISKTMQLYALLEKRGLRVPTMPEDTNGSSKIDQLLAYYDTPAPFMQPTVAIQPISLPDELEHWLSVDTQEWKDAALSPEYLQETIYESLKAKYRPQTGVDHETFLPVYDNTYKEILNQILRRFDNYEEECSNTEVEEWTGNNE